MTDETLENMLKVSKQAIEFLEKDDEDVSD
jgi:DNA-binding XRE family transcriptional regulator